MSLTIVPRAAWGAQHERGSGPAPLPASEVWLHHSVTLAPDLVLTDRDGDGVDDDEEAAMRTLERIGEQRFGRGISYTFAVMPTGRVYEGHGVDRVGAHTARRNSIARAVVLVGNYDTAAVPAAAVNAVAELLVHGKRAGWWKAARLNGGHQQAPGASTACPGRHGMTAVSRINARAAELEATPTGTTDPGGLPDVFTFTDPPGGTEEHAPGFLVHGGKLVHVPTVPDYDRCKASGVPDLGVVSEAFAENLRRAFG